MSTPLTHDDLKLSGAWAGIPEGETRYVSRAALAALPAARVVRDRPWPTMPEADLTVLPLAALIEALGVDSGTDGLVLKCEDRWESWVPFDLIRERDAYLLLYYNGKAPTEETRWPSFGGSEPMSPYYVFVSPARFPDWVDMTAYGMISATQIVEIAVGNEAARYAPYYAGKLAALDPIAAHGRDVFLENCSTCHQGPGEVGGNVSQRPLVILQTHAAFNEPFFRSMMRDPKAVYPDTVMPAQDDLDDEDIGALIAFLKATR